MLHPARRFFAFGCTEGLAARAGADYTDGLAALLPSSSGQDVALSRRKLGFDSPWERQQNQALRLDPGAKPHRRAT
ncbi:hypothetical protein BOSE62_150407 [Bosea sp. 62]|nr:hypothetical protein BOSE46_10435 [Bosea sp. 46]CAD5250321.1 hypothetical protein BOSE21B_10649 [Bosea sp. 21B]CAD5264741.1 hypothetical protein BOSE7B_150486 [Bosea sp. 7B]VVT44289.1 hypothetical protein BOS5A_10422 [Bosea sp. EC-HK365B]VXB10318.1 hypothetical protein BOSE29B_10431 [Bosea sp. 29B]VXB81944.1 hypothetical protein BOSE62_150407 [Bosea sp. 62]VXC32685.1 hypothetical protein BOSE125_20114 [Bosea sp. 125]VXC44207.1 hypothetical protein BOSE127_190114 [Bosea sp. 127]